MPRQMTPLVSLVCANFGNVFSLNIVALGNVLTRKTVGFFICLLYFILFYFICFFFLSVPLLEMLFT